MSKKAFLMLGVGAGLAWLAYLKWQKSVNTVQLAEFDNSSDGFIGVSLSEFTGGYMGKKASDLVSENYKGLLPVMENGIRKGFKNGKWYPHDDGTGVKTVAFGHRILPRENFKSGITTDEAYQLMLNDIDVNADAVVQFYDLITVGYNIGYFDAFCDFCYNAGGGTFNKKIKPLLKQGLVNEALQAVKGHYDAISTGKNANVAAGWAKRNKYQNNMAMGVYSVNT